MKKLIILLVLVSMVLSGCADKKNINGKVIEPYGLFNSNAMKDPNVVYQVSAMGVVAGILLCETIVVPIYIVGWDLFEPVRVKESRDNDNSR